MVNKVKKVAVGILVLAGLFFNEIHSNAQISRWYEPGFAVMSGLSFSDKYAEESSFLFRNCFRFTGGDANPGYFNISLGYSHRSYTLDYAISGEDPYLGNVYRNAFVAQAGMEVRMQNIRKLRKYLHPYVGFVFQRHFNKIKGVEKEIQDYFQLDYNPPLRNFFLEVGSELVTEQWPRFYFSFQYETPLTLTSYGVKPSNETNPSIYYFHDEQPCFRLVLGIRL